MGPRPLDLAHHHFLVGRRTHLNTPRNTRTVLVSDFLELRNGPLQSTLRLTPWHPTPLLNKD